MPSPNVVSLNTMRARSYVLRLPLFTRAMIAAIVGFWIVGLQSWFDVRRWGSLAPDLMGIHTLYRLNTFPLIHLNSFHALLNILALTPLLERFEREHGTLTTLALFFGPLTTIPAFLYVFVERFVLLGSTAVMGASIWVFLLMGIEAIRTYRSNPHLSIGTYNIPTWTMPLGMLVLIAVLVPSSSFLGHLSGLVVGYVFGLGHLKFLAPPERILRWIEGKLNLLGRLPHYVSVDQKTYGRFGVLPSVGGAGAVPLATRGLAGTGPSGQRLGP